jgi:hypothetical protein
MGEKSVEFETALSVKECGFRFKSGIENGRGASAWVGGVTAKLIGGETLSGAHRDVALWAYHSLTGVSHATKLLEVARTSVEAPA